MSISHSLRVRILYKTVLRLHRGLPPEIRPLGDTYAKDEFRRHIKCNDGEAQVFLFEWTRYALLLSKQLGLGIKGKPQKQIGEYISPGLLDNLRDEQVVQLYELLKATKIEDDDNAGDTKDIKNNIK